MTACYCDYDPAEAYWATRPIARKEHQCDECNRQIKPGERYERVRMIGDGCPATAKTCVYCLAMRDLVESRIDCFCWVHYAMLEDLTETVKNCDNIPGLHMALGRIVMEKKRAEKRYHENRREK